MRKRTPLGSRGVTYDIRFQNAHEYGFDIPNLLLFYADYYWSVVMGSITAAQTCAASPESVILTFRLHYRIRLHHRIHLLQLPRSPHCSTPSPTPSSPPQQPSHPLPRSNISLPTESTFSSVTPLRSIVRSHPQITARSDHDGTSQTKHRLLADLAGGANTP